jgi:Condensation domain
MVRSMLAQVLSWLVRPQPKRPAPHLTIAQQDALLDRLLLDKPGEPARFTASFSQQSLWLLKQFNPQSAHNLQVGLRLRGHLNRNALERTLAEIVNRHDTLRTRFELDETQLSQVVLPHCTVELPLEDLSHLDESCRYAEAYALAASHAEAPFDLSQVPLFRFTLIRLAPDDYILTCVLDHIISDGWSMGLFVQELTALYEALSTGRASPVAPLLVQYGDYASWQRGWLTGALLDTQIDYWRKKLHGAPPVLHLAANRARPGSQAFEGASQALTVPTRLVQDLKHLAAQHDATLFMIAFAAFTVLLYGHSMQEDVLIGVPVAGRSRVETEGLIGFFVNMLVLRVNAGGDPIFGDLLAQVRNVALDAFCNSDAPFIQLVETLNPVRSVSHHPIFQVVFASIKSAVQSNSFGALSASPYLVTPRSARFDLTMNLIEGARDNWAVQLEYSTALFDHAGITVMLERYNSILSAIVANPHRHLSGLMPEAFDG